MIGFNYRIYNRTTSAVQIIFLWLINDRHIVQSIQMLLQIARETGTNSLKYPNIEYVDLYLKIYTFCRNFHIHIGMTLHLKFGNIK